MRLSFRILTSAREIRSIDVIFPTYIVVRVYVECIYVASRGVLVANTSELSELREH